MTDLLWVENFVKENNISFELITTGDGDWYFTAVTHHRTHISQDYPDLTTTIIAARKVLEGKLEENNND